MVRIAVTKSTLKEQLIKIIPLIFSADEIANLKFYICIVKHTYKIQLSPSTIPGCIQYLSLIFTLNKHCNNEAMKLCTLIHDHEYKKACKCKKKFFPTFSLRTIKALVVFILNLIVAPI